MVARALSFGTMLGTAGKLSTSTFAWRMIGENASLLTQRVALQRKAEAVNFSGSPCFLRGFTVLCNGAATGSSAEASLAVESVKEKLPVPLVMIDQHTDSKSTIVDLQFGDRLGALLDTMKALQELGLNVTKAKITTEESVGRNRFYITRPDTGEKVTEPDMLEAIRLVILRNLLQYHPESAAVLGVESAVLPLPLQIEVPPKQKRDIATVITIETIDNGKQSRLFVQTADHAGLLLEIVNVLKNLSINVESAEIDTEGFVAKDEFYMAYHGEALNSSMVEVTSNALRYSLTRPDIESEDSY
eukprot:TRINITY_DN5568_c0_g1_i4.p1 TRINITY_DN5568_c0_g1~~TRINITY_DN5568_c0_g1_i4.p1  ORF type:complete len:349 (-),score=74.23 TRINITY_DN5568_c0_g1_i4:250-1155(-)